MNEEKQPEKHWADSYGIDRSAGGWRHDGIEIFMDNRGSFIAKVKGEVVHKPSLLAMKKHITKSKIDEFKPFTGLIKPSYNRHMNDRDPFERVHIKEFRRTGNRTHDLYEFVTVEQQVWPNRTLYQVVKDTPQNEKLLKQMLAHHKESIRIKEKREREFSAMQKKLTWVHVDEIAKEIPR